MVLYNYILQQEIGIPPEANLGLCYRGFQIIIFWPAADLPTQPPAWHSNAETPLTTIVQIEGSSSCCSGKLSPTNFS